MHVIVVFQEKKPGEASPRPQQALQIICCTTSGDSALPGLAPFWILNLSPALPFISICVCDANSK
jgi:hypothetical protein